MEAYYIRALHIIFVVTWFAGLFYMPRLLVYAAEANAEQDEKRDILLNQFRLMQRRLWYGITWPSAIITLVIGLLMLHYWSHWQIPTWLWVKLGFVLGLYLYHMSIHMVFRQQQRGVFRYSGNQLRLWNEVATVFLFAIVFLAVMKSTISMLWGLLGLVILIAVLMAAIMIYKRSRERKD